MESPSEACTSRLLTLTITKSKERESNNVCRQTYSFHEVKLDQATGYASEENRSRTNMISDKDLAYVTSVSVGFGSKELQRENGGRKRRGRGRGRKEGNFPSFLPLPHPHISFLALSLLSARAKH